MRLGLKTKLVIVLLATTAMAFVLIYFAATRLTSSFLIDQELRFAARSADAISEVLYHLADDEGRLQAALRSAAQSAGLESVQVLDDRFETMAPGDCTPAEILVGPSALRELAESKHGARMLYSPTMGEVFAAVRPIRGGGYVFSARGTAEFYERRESVITLLILWSGVVMLAIAVAGILLMRQVIVRPIERLVQSAGAFATGAGGSLFDTSSSDEFGMLSDSVTAMAERIRNDRQRIEEQVAQLQKMNRELQDAQEQLIRTEKLASVGQLAAGVAHEIGNPIGIIQGYADMLAAGELGEEDQTQAYVQIARASARIDATIKDLLDFSRPAVDEEVSCSLLSVTGEVIELVRPQKRFRGVEIRLDSDLPESTCGRIPPSRYKQVLLNLLFNASDAMEGKGRIDVGITRQQGMIHASVADTGPGVDDNLKIKIFDPFFTTKAVGQGTGLGLFVAHTILSLYGGRISVRNREEGGASFLLELADEHDGEGTEIARPTDCKANEVN